MLAPFVRSLRTRGGAGEAPDLDTSLVSGAAFRCRPGCGLCCYARPAVTAREADGLVRLDASVPIRDLGNGYGKVGSRPRGGACHFLSDGRCGAYDARPFPCREFPLHVHIGARVQPTIVFGCPGASLGPILASVESARGAGPAPVGLEAEFGRVRAELERRPVRAWCAEARERVSRLARRLERDGLWSDPARLAERLASRPPRPAAPDFPAEPPPRIDRDGWEALPLLFDERLGSVAALAGRPDGRWEILALREEGGSRGPRSLRLPPAEPPALDAAGGRLLDGYLAYVARRDAFLWGFLAELADSPEPPSLAERAASALRTLGAQALSRAAVLRPDSESGAALGEADVARGVRAVDAEALDRPTLGRIL